jgi:hypothetical protein
MLTFWRAARRRWPGHEHTTKQHDGVTRAHGEQHDEVAVLEVDDDEEHGHRRDNDDDEVGTRARVEVGSRPVTRRACEGPSGGDGVTRRGH